MINTHISNLQAIKAITMGFFTCMSSTQRAAAMAERTRIETQLAQRAAAIRAREAEQSKKLFWDIATKVGMQRAAETNESNRRALNRARSCNLMGRDELGLPLAPGEVIVAVIHDEYGFAIPPKSS